MTIQSGRTVSVLLISFVFSPNLGGIETHLDDLVEYLSNKNYRVTVLTYQPLLSDKSAPIVERRGTIEIRRIPWIKFGLYHKLEKTPILQVLYLVPPLLIYTIMYLTLYRKKFDIIQTHGFNMAIVGAIASAIFNIPFTVNTHVSFRFEKDSLYTNILSLILNRSRKILVLTPQAKKELLRIGVNHEKIIIYHYWVDKVFRPQNKVLAKRKLKLDPNKFSVLFVGRFIKTKGVELLLGAVSSVGPEVQFIFAGAGPLTHLVENMAANDKRITYLGELNKKELAVCYAAADVCVIPSVASHSAYTEGIPRVMIESLSCGTPVIATEAGGLKDYVTSEVGIVVNADTHSIARGISEFSQNKDIGNIMYRHCIALAHSEFGLRKNANIIELSLL